MAKEKTPNAKNSDFAPPVDLASVKPQDYSSSIGSGRGSAGQEEATGFSPQLSGHGKAGANSTTSFDAQPHGQKLTPKGEAGQEEGSSARQATTSIVGRIGQDQKK